MNNNIFKKFITRILKQNKNLLLLKGVDLDYLDWNYTASYHIELLTPLKLKIEIFSHTIFLELKANSKIEEFLTENKIEIFYVEPECNLMSLGFAESELAKLEEIFSTLISLL